MESRELQSPVSSVTETRLRRSTRAFNQMFRDLLLLSVPDVLDLNRSMPAMPQEETEGTTCSDGHIAVEQRGWNTDCVAHFPSVIYATPSARLVRLHTRHA